jgi:putative salt-induced outer membrane protein
MATILPASLLAAALIAGAAPPGSDPAVTAQSTEAAAAEAAIIEEPESLIMEVPPPAIFLGAAPPAPPALPPAIARLIRAAMASGDEAAVNSIVRHARQAFPSAQEEIAALRSDFDRALADRRSAAAQAAHERLASPRVFDNWQGNIELGASRTTGNVESFGFYGAIEAERRGVSLDHSISARADFQETNGIQSAERINASWRPRYRIDSDLNVYGLAQYEHDPLIALSSRYTVGGGVGYSVVDEADMKLRLDGGPAIRRTRTTAGEVFTAVGGRASLDFDWKITPTLELKQDGSFIMDGGNESGRSVTAIETRLFGPVRARLSYELRYEHNSVIGTESFNTSGRTTIVVGL